MNTHDDVENLAVSFLNVDMSKTSPMLASDASFSLKNTAKTIQNYIHLFIVLLPIVIPIDVLCVSIINMNLKGFVYIGFLIGSYVLRVGFYSMIAMFQSSDSYSTKGYNCGLSVFVLSYTLAYICTPMFFLKNINVVILAMLLFFLLLDIFYKHWNMCQFSSETVYNVFCGFFCGFFSCFLMYMGGSKGYLFFSEVSSKESCSVPQKQKFKCNVFKNGQLLKM